MGLKLLTKRLRVTHVTHCATPPLILYREASLRYQINFRTMCILKSVLSILVLIQQTLTDHKILTLTSGYIKINTLCWIYGINLWPIINILLLKHLFLISKVSHCWCRWLFSFFIKLTKELVTDTVRLSTVGTEHGRHCF